MIFRVQAAIENCRRCQHCCAFTVVKYVKETCETVHSIPKETCVKVKRITQQKQVDCVQGEKKKMTRYALVQSRIGNICGALPYLI